MEKLQYDIATYLTSVKMSSKIRVLVEGVDDRSHVSNIISSFFKSAKYKIDLASEIKGSCSVTMKNNRAKIEKIHNSTKGNNEYTRLVFLCDREVRGFSFDPVILDNVPGHFIDGNLSWTKGHSIENYFLDLRLVTTGLRFLTSSAHKDSAIQLFESHFESSIRLIAKLTLASREFGSSAFPCGAIKWENITVTPQGGVSIDSSSIKNPRWPEFKKILNGFNTCVDNSDVEICALLCRGHTAIVMLKRIFAACLFSTISSTGDKAAAEYDANALENISERIVSNALSEAWIGSVRSGNADYPAPLIEAIEALVA